MGLTIKDRSTHAYALRRCRAGIHACRGHVLLPVPPDSVNPGTRHSASPWPEPPCSSKPGASHAARWWRGRRAGHGRGHRRSRCAALSASPILRMGVGGQDALMLVRGNAVGMSAADVDGLPAGAVAKLDPVRLASVAPSEGLVTQHQAGIHMESRERAERTTRLDGDTRRSCGVHELWLGALRDPERPAPRQV